MEVADSAYRHGIASADIHHAWDNAIGLYEFTYHGDDRILAIGPDRTGALLEVVAVTLDTSIRIIHADRLRRRFVHHLR